MRLNGSEQNLVRQAQGAAPESSRNQKVYDASKMYEAQFLREMTKAMRKSVVDGGLLKKNMGEKIFQEKLDHQYVDKWVNRGGVGLADVIYNHLMERYHGVSIQQKPQGPLPLSHQSPTQVTKESKDPKGSRPSFHVSGTGSTSLQSPWSGVVRFTSSLQNSLLIEHDDGLRTAFLIPQGEILLREGQRVEAGQRIALLDADKWNFLMQLDDTSLGEKLGQ